MLHVVHCWDSVNSHSLYTSKPSESSLNDFVYSGGSRNWVRGARGGHFRILNSFTALKKKIMELLTYRFGITDL